MARKTKSSIRQRASVIKKKGSVLKAQKKTIATKVKKKRIASKPIPKKITKSVKKTAIKPVIKVKPKKASRDGVETKLIENFVAMQKVMVNLSVKFDNLANQISKLLELFEISAKSLAEKDFNLEKSTQDTKEIKEKVGNLFEQNKVIARGLTLLHEGPAGPGEMQEPQMPVMPAPARQMQRPPMPPLSRRAPPQQPPAAAGEEQYQKSLSSQSQQFKKLPGSSDTQEQ